MTRVSASKILLNIDWIRRDILPVHLQVDLCGTCNQRCKWCFFKGGLDSNTGVWRDKELRKHILPAPVANRITREHWNYGFGRAITFVGGGEPLLHPRITSILNNTQQPMGIITNLAVKISPGLKEALQRCKWIRVSLDATTKETYERLHGVDMFQLVLDNMDKVRARVFGMFGISYLVHPDNVEEIAALGEIATLVKANYIQFKPVYSEEEPVPYSTLQKQIERLKLDFGGEIIDDYEERIRILKGQKAYPHLRCAVPYYRIQVSADGNVYPCCIYKYSPEYSYGSVLLKSLTEVVLSDRAKRINEKLLIDSCPPCWDKDVQITIYDFKEMEDTDFV